MHVLHTDREDNSPRHTVRIDAGPNERDKFAEFAAFLAGCDLTHGFDRFESVVRRAIELFNARSVLELGAGRSPLLGAMSDLELEAAINDIDQRELDRAGASLRKLCFDISGACPSEQQFDLIFSRSVLEHIENGEQALRNSAMMLAPGGISLHFFPTLYCPPFVANKLLPEGLADRLLTLFHPRNREVQPKFPAHYSWCTSTYRRRDAIARLGYSRVELVPFYDNPYFDRVPIIRTVSRAFQGLATRQDWRLASSFAFLLAQR